MVEVAGSGSGTPQKWREMKLQNSPEAEFWAKMAAARATVVFQNSRAYFTARECAEFADQMVEEVKKRL